MYYVCAIFVHIGLYIFIVIEGDIAHLQPVAQNNVALGVWLGPYPYGPSHRGMAGAILL